MSETGPIETVKQFPATPAGLQQRWQVELDAAIENQKEMWKEGDSVVEEFLGKKRDGARQRLNLYYADVKTKDANLSGMPKVRAKRRFADANDDVARVSAEILERHLNTDIDRESDGFRRAITHCRGDWLKPGLGQMRFRYTVEMGEQPGQPAIDGAAEVPPVPVKVKEDVETDYVYWKDFLWSPCRTWDEVDWVAFKAEMTKDQFVERFGEEKAGKVQLSRPEIKAENISDSVKDAWSRAEIWEIWCKSSGSVYWWSKGMAEILDEKPDPLQIPGFFPCPEPLCANVTTSKFMPKATYYLAEDLYVEAHSLTERIRNLVKAIKVAGVYDKANDGLKRLLSEACENELIPVSNFPGFLEKGGMAGAVQFLPLEETVEAVVQLVQQRNLVKQDLYEITGQSDIMRGNQAQKETATTSRIKARFGSSRIQAEQDEFTRFVSGAQRIRAAIICKHFDEQTILKRANMVQQDPPPGMPPQPPEGDIAIAPQAVALLKSNFSDYRVEVDADSLSLTDFDAVRQERTEFLQAMTVYLAEVAKIAPVAPTALPFLLELGKHSLAAFRGAAQLEGIFDRMIEAAKQPPPPKPPDPRMMAEQVKAQATQMKAKTDMAGSMLDFQVKKAEHGMEMQKLAAETQATQIESATRVAEAQATPEREGRDFP